MNITLLVLGLLAGVWLWYGPFVSQWGALLVWTLALVFCGRNLWKRLPETTRLRWPQFAAPALLAGAVGALYHPFALGHMPWMADHLVHQHRARLFFEHFLSEGRLSGWTHMTEAGVPFETLYPPGADIFLSFVHLAGFGKLSWEATYAFGFFLFLLFYVGTFYWIGRRFGGPLAGLVAGFLALTDAGAFRQGGWSFTVEWGVWPISFSLALSLWSLHFADRMHRGEGGFWRSALLGAAAVCTHPFALFVVFPLHFLLALHGRTLTLSLLYFGLSAGAIFLFSAWWLVPFLAYGPDFSAPVPALAGSLSQAADGLVQGALWANADAWGAMLGIAGMIWALVRRPHPLLIALSLYALLVFSLGSTSVLSGLDVFSWMPSLSHVQFPRFLMVVKAASFLAAGALAASLGSLRPAFETDVPSGEWRRLLWVPAALLLAFPVGQKVVEHYFLPLTEYDTNPAWKKDVQAMARHLAREAASRPGFFRVALDSSFNDHRLVPIVTHTGLPVVKLSYMPAETFIHAAHENPSDVPRARDELARLNVAYVVSMGPSSLPDLKPLKNFGDVHLYEFAGFSPARFELDPPGRASIVRFDDERIELDVSGLPPEGGVLRLHVAPFVRWQAAVNGRSAAIAEYRPTPRQTLMQLPVQNGRVELTYPRRLPDWAGFFLTMAGLLLLLFFWSWAYDRIFVYIPYLTGFIPWVRLKLLKIRYDCLLYDARRFGRECRQETEKNLEDFQEMPNKPLPVKEREEAGTERQKPEFWGLGKKLRSVPLSVWLLAAVGAGLLAVFSGVKIASSSEDFALHRARVRLETGNDTRNCFYVFPERFQCRAAHRFVGRDLREIGKKVHRVIWAHPVENARLQIEFPDVWIAGPLSVDAGIADSGSGPDVPVTLRVYYDDRLVAATTRSRPGVWEPLVVSAPEYLFSRVTVRFEIAAPQVGGRHFVFQPHF